MSSVSEKSVLYSAIAGGYDRTYAELTHRRVYDRLALEHVGALVLPERATIIDVGCGTGRWVPYFLERGHAVTGIEQAPGMIAALRDRELGSDFRLIEGAMEQVEIAPGSADLVLGMGSVQYSSDPAAMLARFATWLRPGGHVCLYVDSLVALVVELIRTGRSDEAMRCVSTRRGLFEQAGHSASLHLYDRDTLESEFVAAGLVEVRSHGLAVGATALGRAGLTAAMQADEERTMAGERVLSNDRSMTDCGLHILTIGRKPGP
jgi:SAM-dependent methyltransferase